MFRTAPLSIIGGSSLYKQQWYMSYRFADCLLASRQQNQTNKIIECGPGTVAHDVQDVGPPWLSLFKTKTYSYK